MKMISCFENRFNLPASEDEINAVDQAFAIISGTPRYEDFWKGLRKNFNEMKEKTIFSGTLGAYFFGSFVGTPETTPFIHECLLPLNAKRVERNESILLSIGANNKLIHEGSTNVLRAYFYQSTIPSSYENVLELVKKNIKLVEIYLFKGGKFVYSGFLETGFGARSQTAGRSAAKSIEVSRIKPEQEGEIRPNELELSNLFDKKGNIKLSTNAPSVYKTEEFFFVGLAILAALGFCLFILKKAV